MKPSYLIKISACLVALGLLGGCTVYESIANYINSDRAEKCPDVMVLGSTATLPAFDPNQEPDPTNLLYTATISNSDLSCNYRSKQNKAKSDITLTFRASRPAGGAKAKYHVPYYVALMTNGHVLDKQIYWLDLKFAEGVSQTEAEVDIDDIALRPSRGKKPTSYHYVVGFQLTQTQIDYLKKMGQYEP